MSSPAEVSEHVLRARRTAATARAFLAACGLILAAGDTSLVAHPPLALAGFTIILVTAGVQLLAPRAGWSQIEESCAALAGVFIVGLGDQRVTVLSALWLAAVASGVLARGGRVHWVGRAVLLAALLLPVVREQRLGPEHAALSAAAIALLLTCGRVTQELSHLLAQARHDADYDGLTGALSRAAFRAALSGAAEAADASAPLAVLLIDLDSFGQVNKAHGHATGDALLTSVGAVIGGVIGAERPLGRLGGDEFAAIVVDPDPAAVARQVLDELERGGSEQQAVAASVGIARAPRDGRDADALLRAGDVALRVAKRTGKQQVVMYAGESLADEGPTGARGALARMIGGEGLSMVVQPIFELPGGAVHAFEALARFGEHSVDSPLHWFALADEFGLRDELELACLHAALALFASRPPGSLLSVNISGPVLLDPRAQALLEAQPEIDGLIVEITEDALVENGAGLQAVIAPLLARGVRVAVDDMGAGYSGLRQITALHPTYLKLDRSLIHDIHADSDRAALITALLGYTRHTGGHLVAEGVENAEELAALMSLGVNLAQGYHLGRPGPPWPGCHPPDSDRAHTSDHAHTFASRAPSPPVATGAFLAAP